MAYISYSCGFTLHVPIYVGEDFTLLKVRLLLKLARPLILFKLTECNDGTLYGGLAHHRLDLLFNGYDIMLIPPFVKFIG